MTPEQAKDRLAGLIKRRDALWREVLRLEAKIAPVRGEWHEAKEECEQLEGFIRLSKFNPLTS